MFLFFANYLPHLHKEKKKKCFFFFLKKKKKKKKKNICLFVCLRRSFFIFCVSVMCVSYPYKSKGQKQRAKERKKERNKTLGGCVV